MTLTTFNDKKILLHADRIFSSRRPITADIFLTNYCNNACPYCNYKRWSHSPGARYIKYDDFVKYASRLRGLGVLGVILTGGGEPSINPDFKEICLWLERSGIPYGLNTNMLKYPGDIHPNFLKVSLDAGDRETYIKKRGVDAFDVVVENIKRFLNQRNAKTRFGLQLLAESYKELDPFLSFARELPVDYISVRPIESTRGSYYESPINNLNAKLILAKLEFEAGTDRRISVSPKWKYALTPESIKDCPANWCQMAIDETGQVLYCCQKPYEVVGHILDDDDILQKKAAFNTNCRLCDYPCRLTGYNQLLNALPKGFNNAEFI